MDNSIQTSIVTMRRHVERMYNLPPGEREIAEAFFARADTLNATDDLTQRSLDVCFVDMLIRHRFAHWGRRESDPDYILYNS